MLPVTQQWLDQIILALTTVGNISFRGALELMQLVGEGSRERSFGRQVWTARSLAGLPIANQEGAPQCCASSAGTGTRRSPPAGFQPQNR